MDRHSDLEARITALESQVRQLGERVRHTQQDAAAARVLAGGADRDVAEIRTEIREFREHNTQVLNAIRADLTDLRQNMATLERKLVTLDGKMVTLEEKVDNGFAEMHSKFARVDDGFVEMRGRLDATAAGLQQIAGLITTLVEQQGGERGDE